MSRRNTVCYWLLKILPNSPTSYMYSSTAQIQMTATSMKFLLKPPKQEANSLDYVI